MSGCGKHDHNTGSCVCDTVMAIHKMQEAVERNDDCDNSCFNLLSNESCHCHNNRHRHDTVPFFLQNDQGIPFFTATVREAGRTGCEVVITPFFRVSKVKDCCATLELLDTGLDFSFPPQGHNSMAMFSAIQNDAQCLDLKRTGKCITVDLKCFCAIQCLDPSFVTN